MNTSTIIIYGIICFFGIAGNISIYEKFFRDIEISSKILFLFRLMCFVPCSLFILIFMIIIGMVIAFPFIAGFNFLFGTHYGEEDND